MRSLFISATVIALQAVCAIPLAAESSQSASEPSSERAQQPAVREAGESNLSRRAFEDYNRYIREVVPRLDRLTEQTSETHRRFLQELAGPPTAELEEMNRRVTMTLGMSVRDDENWPSDDEWGGIDPQPMSVGLDRQDFVRSLHWTACAGDEVRVDVAFTATVHPPDGAVAVDGTMTLFEGDDCDTEDQAAQVLDLDYDGVTNIDFSLPPSGNPHTIDAHIRGPDTSEAWVVAHFNNTKRD